LSLDNNIMTWTGWTLKSNNNIMTLPSSRLIPKTTAGWTRCIVALPLCLASVALAGTVDGTTVDLIDDNQAYQQWHVINGGVFNMLGSRAHTVVADYSTVSINTSQLSVNGESNGVNLHSSVLSVDGSDINGTDVALRVTRNSPLDVGGSTAIVRNSQLRGGNAAVGVTESELTVIDSTLTGSKPTGYGLRQNQGAVLLRNSQVSGAARGLSMERSTYPGVSQVTLEHSAIEGRLGAAVYIDNRGLIRPTLNVRDGSTLTGAEGLILEIVRSSLAQVNVSNSHLVGNILLHAPLAGQGAGELDLAFDHARLTGNIDVQQGAQAQLSLVNDSQVVGDLRYTDTSHGSVVLNHSEFSGSIFYADASAGEVALENGSVFTGLIDRADASTGNVKLDGSRLAGTVRYAGSGIGDVMLANRSELDAALTYADNRTGTVALAGGSRWLGTIDTGQNAVAHVRLDNAQFSGALHARDNSTLEIQASNGTEMVGDIDSSQEASVQVRLDSTRFSGALHARDNSTLEVQASNGTQMVGDIDTAQNASLQLGLNNARLAGTVHARENSAVEVQASNGTQMIGDINTGQEASVQLGLDNTQLTGSLHAQDNSTLTVQAGNGTLIAGDINTSGGALVQLELDSARLTGAVHARDNGTMKIQASHGTQIVSDVLADPGAVVEMALTSGAALTGRLVGIRSLSLGDQAQWWLVDDSTLSSLHLDGGQVHFGQAADFHRLELGELSGNGTFAMDVDFAAGQSDLLEVTGAATGRHRLLIASTGSDPLTDASVPVVHIGGGDARFDLVGGEVDLGTWSYGLRNEVNDWYLDATQRTVSPAAASVLALFNTAPTVWHGELSSLRSRLGELRESRGQGGVWTRAYGSKSIVEPGAGLSYHQQQHGFSLGADAALPLGDGQWLAGVLAGHSEAELDMRRGAHGTVKSYYAGVYATWLDAQSGYYFDGLLKVNRFRNDSRVSLSDGRLTRGRYANSGVGAAAEFGRRFDFEGGSFLEPSLQLASVITQGRSYTLDNGMQAQGDRSRSLLGKVGVTAGHRFAMPRAGYAQPYVRLAYAREFAGDNGVSVNGNRFDNDLAGARGEVGAGLSVLFSTRWNVHADVQYSDGEKLSQPWAGTVGLRFAW
jgi:outer membrane autotransporter protein